MTAKRPTETVYGSVELNLQGFTMRGSHAPDVVIHAIVDEGSAGDDIVDPSKTHCKADETFAEENRQNKAHDPNGSPVAQDL